MERVKCKILKRLVLLLLLFIGVSASAQVIKFRTVAYAENKYNYYTQKWSGWSNWEKSNMLLTIDLQNDLIAVYSPVTQIYKIYKAEESYYDSDGDFNLPFKFIDQDGDRGTLRLLQRASGSSEVYIEFLNIRWCYKVLRL
jgi:hypothetical protein|nr:MAG TPA: hypothetical protein [Caudoviricetes sp.]